MNTTPVHTGSSVRRIAPGLMVASLGAAAAWGVHWAMPAVPTLTAVMVLGIAVAHLPVIRDGVRGVARPGLSVAGKRLMRLAVVLLGINLSIGKLREVGLPTMAMVVVVVVVTFVGTWWLGHRIGVRGDQPLLIAVGYAICGASAIGAVSAATDSDEDDAAASVAVVTLCGTLAIAVLPLLQHPLGLDDLQFGRWVGASVHDVGQVVATASAAGPAAVGDAIVVKMLRILLLAPLVAVVAWGLRRRWVSATNGQVPDSAGAGGHGKRPALVPLFVVGFVAMVFLRSTGWLSEGVLDGMGVAQHLLLSVALFGIGTAVHLPTLARTGGRTAVLGLCAWIVVAGVSYAGVMVTS
ncbi:YeiH family protein [Paractinoplanes hotanensis]|uniref:Sulfate exporter family transporter n=1 Tax=Paractinoplanes hotanensis TaxID=2906497 RepID=A0ABT0YEV2_9ACTN|nr:putative sulfate exporter family transporter [Actinoplanes hotanensis]MCM4084275.1 putative sulfate exporter family transporter [Actinoplanes hotanensis]